MFIKIGEAKLFFDVYGSKLQLKSDRVVEKPTLIVLHGGHGFADHTLYVEFWSQFSDITQVIFLDQRGCGRSDARKPEEWNLQQWAEDLYQFCKLLGIEKPIIAGVSMGGHVMCEFVRNYSDFPGGLIFCNTEARLPLDLVGAKLKELAGEKSAQACYDFYTNPTKQTMADYFKYCLPYYGKNAYSKEELNRCKQNPEVFIHYFREQILKINYVEDMNKIHCPTLLLVGEDSLHVVPAAIEMAEKIDPKFLTIKIFKNIGGPVYKDKPAESYQVVREFLDKFIL